MCFKDANFVQSHWPIIGSICCVKWSYLNIAVMQLNLQVDGILETLIFFCPE